MNLNLFKTTHLAFPKKRPLFYQLLIVLPSTTLAVGLPSFVWCGFCSWRLGSRVLAWGVWWTRWLFFIYTKSSFTIQKFEEIEKYNRSRHCYVICVYLKYVLYMCIYLDSIRYKYVFSKWYSMKPRKPRSSKPTPLSNQWAAGFWVWL